MRQLSIRQKILLLALFPLLLLAAVSTWVNVSQSVRLKELSGQSLNDSLFDARKQQLANYMELAITGIQPLLARGDTDAAKAQLRRLRFDDGSGYFFVYNHDGVQVVSADNPAREGNNYFGSTSPDGRYLVQEYIELGRNGGGYVEYSWPKLDATKGSPKLAHIMPVPGTDWLLGTGFYIDDLLATVNKLESELSASVHRGLVNSALSATLLLALIAAAGLVIARGIHAPIRQAVHTMENIARGEGDLTRRLDDGQQNELGVLARSFNQFAGQISDLVQDTRHSANTLQQASNDLQRFMQETEQGISRQHHESDQLATAMNQMSATAQEVAGSAASAAQAAEQAENLVNSAQQQLQETIAVIDGLEHQVAAGVDIIQRLGQESDQIGTVLDVIRGVAEQTNLLALNAAIEAARAGEQGRGFAVVADEVRTLAGRTQTSTEEIHTMITRLQQGAKEAVQAIETIRDGSSHTVAEARRIDEALLDIGTAVNTINLMNAQIASAAEEQTQVSENINTNVHEIVAIAEQTNAGSTAASKTSRQLGELASHLQQLVSRYRTS
ncbi:methyl-accepting chemotaxis protein [Oceanimonas baumannii]|uniref:Chemotaxis protein n=1 Tax=Oceanimonas baumannii TaxID=129578 RepID=A0A235CME3_9GAMM|nr:methyl-accepting chemotaxis protein [Oceanimonas baumannii]OYD25599.1 chemotaxis protein [Oceanimonas baumannii]TDW61189.1 methyl-accepting chemotaxis sensory transducer with Cache sensor [Oceanimonas baumannii]